MASVIAVLGNMTSKAAEICKKNFLYHLIINVEYFDF